MCARAKLFVLAWFWCVPILECSVKLTYCVHSTTLYSLYNNIVTVECIHCTICEGDEVQVFTKHSNSQRSFFRFIMKILDNKVLISIPEYFPANNDHVT